MPSVTLLIITGFGLSGLMKLNIFETGWIFWSTILIIISGAVYMVKVVPTQKKILALAKDVNKFNNITNSLNNGICGVRLQLSHPISLWF